MLSVWKAQRTGATVPNSSRLRDYTVGTQALGVVTDTSVSRALRMNNCATGGCWLPLIQSFDRKLFVVVCETFSGPKHHKTNANQQEASLYFIQLYICISIKTLLHTRTIHQTHRLANTKPKAERSFTSPTFNATSSRLVYGGGTGSPPRFSGRCGFAKSFPYRVNGACGPDHQKRSGGLGLLYFLSRLLDNFLVSGCSK